MNMLLRDLLNGFQTRKRIFVQTAYTTSLLAAGLLCIGQATAATPANNVQAIAKQVRDNFFSIAKGDEIAKILENEAKAGKYDKYTVPGDLATALSNRMKEFDKHFNVLWNVSASANQVRPSSTASSIRAFEAVDQRYNYGFSKVEILPGNIGYINVSRFAMIDTNDAQSPARKAADAALSMIANTNAVIIDVRENPGGAPQMVGYLVSAFHSGKDIYNDFHTRTGIIAEAPSTFHANPRTNVPLYILTSKSTGSAAEGFPYTLKAAKRATLIGETTYGGANPGRAFDAGDGFSVFISTGKSLNPFTGTNWEGAGAEPDIKVKAEEALHVAQVKALNDLLATNEKANTEHEARRPLVWALDALQPPTVAAWITADYVGNYLGNVISADGKQLRFGPKQKIMVPVAQDVFIQAGRADQRYTFVRDVKGKVVALEILSVDGPTRRYTRNTEV
nr:S41 family peptidase [uncultured Undibacterium sp.]